MDPPTCFLLSLRLIAKVCFYLEADEDQRINHQLMGRLNFKLQNALQCGYLLSPSISISIDQLIDFVVHYKHQ
jgi:hypothetical protein